MKASRAQETGHSSEAGICRLPLNASRVGCQEDQEKATSQDHRSRVVFSAPLTMTAPREAALPGSHLPSFLSHSSPAHSVNPCHSQLKVLPSSKGSNHNQSGVCTPTMPNQDSLKQHRLVSLFISLNHLGTFLLFFFTSHPPSIIQTTTTTTTTVTFTTSL